MLTILKSDNETEPIQDPRRHLISIFNKFYTEGTAKRNPIPWGAMMKMMERQFVSVDESSGECFIEYPDEESWTEQVKGFFSDEWARTKVRFHFSYLMKRYGGFADVEIKKKPNIETPLSKKSYYCEKCKKNHAADFWCEK